MVQNLSKGVRILNKSKIEWCDSTWNPVTGCLHGCEYCYAEKIANRFGKISEDTEFFGLPELAELYVKHENPYPFKFQPTFHRYRLDEPKAKTKQQNIFVCSMADLFGDWVPDEWIKKVFNTVLECDQHKFMFLTKNPKRYSELFSKDIGLPINALYGFSVTNLENIKTVHAASIGVKNFVSIEPLLSGPNNLIEFRNIDWIIVGSQTGPGAKPPEPQWIDDIVTMARAQNIPIFLKNNLNWPVKIQEFPWDEGMGK
jgi:protein gp37